MFGKRKHDQTPQQGINLINEGTRIQGDFNAQGDIRIDGQLYGDVQTRGRLAIGASGMVKGQLNGNMVDIAGEVEGDVLVSGVLTLRKSAKVLGDLTVGKLVIEEGAMFSGQCTMTDMVKTPLHGSRAAEETAG
ncbi:MAG: cell shape determination protein CcmA [Sphingobacteriaceae bacterium]|nr:cell shape determination protein CcmA [Sphingobacteriaceae bacterium]